MKKMEKNEVITHGKYPHTTIITDRSKLLPVIANFLSMLDIPYPLTRVITFLSSFSSGTKTAIVYFLLKKPVGSVGGFRQVLKLKSPVSVYKAVDVLKRDNIIKISDNREEIIKLKNFYLNKSHLFRMSTYHFHKVDFYELVEEARKNYIGMISAIRRNLGRDVVRRIDDYPFSIAQEIITRRNFPESERVSARDI